MVVQYVLNSDWGDKSYCVRVPVKFQEKPVIKPTLQTSTDLVSPEAMTEAMFGTGNDQWVCPNDRQLALRAKLQTGWSVHTFRTDRQRKRQILEQQEVDIILSVIHRAERLEQIEQLRIGRLVDRLDNMRKSAVGNGLSQCLLCGDVLGLLGTPSVLCQDCCKKVCTKCGIENQCSPKKSQWLCKICSEHREVWKRSGAWFYKALPKFVRPGKEGQSWAALGVRGTQKEGQKMSRSPISRTYAWAHSKVVSSDSESEQSESSMGGEMSSQGFKEDQHLIDTGLTVEPSRTPTGLSWGTQGSLLSQSRSSIASESLHSTSPPIAAPPEDYDAARSWPSPVGAV
ncbi:hypothetical protein UPYG_G00124650 [Umbra pygmaea]|uniref:Rabphilin 3A-like protein n=1 Tax=Umbra pygmaea TaxID=75934 RepID=A0ABD0X606_UMBPY